MAKDLKVYDHLNYNEKLSEESDDFVDFLFKHSEANAPEVDESKAWEVLNQRINRPSNSFMWVKIAASIAILAILSIALYLYEPTVNQVYVSSAEETVTVTFPDGSIGILNKNSSFSYPEKFSEQRNVSFTGEAYFDIKKSDKPFIIDVDGVDVRVLGTAFNLITNEENKVKLYVDRGLVAFDDEGLITKVAAGEEASFNRSDATVELKDVVSNNIMSWRNGVFNFDNTPLDQALNELSEYYDVEFEFGNEKLRACKISATFDRQTLKQVLTTLSSILDVKTSTTQKTVKISGKGC